MAWTSVKLVPGLNTQLTPTANTAGYTATDLGRYKAGLFQKLGGWSKYYSSTVDGVPKATHAWQDLAGNDRLAIGTTSRLFDLNSGVLRDITPQTKTTNPAPSFTTVAGSPIVTIVDAGINTVTVFDSVYFNTPVTVDTIILSGLYRITSYVAANSYTITAATNGAAGVAAVGAVPTFTTTSGSPSVSVAFANHGLSVGDDIVFPLSTAVGGVTISGRYEVQSVTPPNAFVIVAARSATSTAGISMNSGNAGFVYYIAIGPTSGAAYGVGLYGVGLYGVGALTAQTGTPIASTDWTLDNWGELLVGCTENGGVYYWGPASGFSTASVITEGPAFNSGAFVSTAQQMIIAYGSTVNASIGVYQDPLLVRWCDSENLFDWTDTLTNQAGSYRLPTGSRIVGGGATPHRNLIWTDVSLWSLDYIGSSLVFGPNEIGSNCGLIAKHAWTKLADTVYWMGSSSFYALTGAGVVQIPCPVWDAVFQNLDTTNASKCFAGSNTAFSEIFFFYPSQSGGLGYCDKYAKLNTIEGTWDIGNLQRNTWLDQSVIGRPVAATNAGIIYQHETSADADDSPLISYFKTGWFYLDEGREIVFIDRIIPDFRWGEYGGSEDASIKFTIYVVKYPGDTPVVLGPYTVTKATNAITKRFRGRQAMVECKSDDLGSFWRLGLVRFRYSRDGRM